AAALPLLLRAGERNERILEVEPSSRPRAMSTSSPCADRNLLLRDASALRSEDSASRLNSSAPFTPAPPSPPSPPRPASPPRTAKGSPAIEYQRSRRRPPPARP